MPLTRDQTISLVLSRLDRSGDTDLQSALELEIIHLQEQVLEGAPFKPWFLETSVQNLATSVEMEGVALPDGFLREVEDRPWSYYSTTSTAPDKWIDLVKDDYAAISEYYAGYDYQAPVKYALGPGSILLRPIPDVAYTIRSRFFKRDVELNSNISNNWLANANDVVVAEMCRVGAEIYLKDAEMVERFEAAAQRAWDRLRRENISRQMAARDMSRGDD